LAFQHGGSGRLDRSLAGRAVHGLNHAHADECHSDHRQQSKRKAAGLVLDEAEKKRSDET
jgi:hypothetical protein